ncbi:TPA: hypothetical protein I8Y22_002301 [Raoultella planticola]|nr:hypothetical protein [Raoultella planticola]
MPDFSLMFFAAIILSLLVYVIRSIMKSQNKKETIFSILIWVMLAFAIAYIAFSDNVVETFLYLSSILVILFFTVTVLSALIDLILVKACIARALKKIHSQNKLDIYDIFKLKQSMLYSNKAWYIAHSTINGFTLIGLNKFKDKPHSNKQFNMKALSGESYRADSITPFQEEEMGKVSVICPLKEFYDSGKENRKIVYDYLLKLKNEKF